MKLSNAVKAVEIGCIIKVLIDQISDLGDIPDRVQIRMKMRAVGFRECHNPSDIDYI